jgi:thymidylate synthase
MLGLSLRTSYVRDLFKALLQEKQFTTVNREGSMTDLVGNTTIEIVGASFIADEDAIFGEVNWDYVRREEEWYNSQSLNVNDIPGGAPQIWKTVADKDGFINSNYGWCIYSSENGFLQSEAERKAEGRSTRLLSLAPSQYEQALQELKKNPESRRAIMIYTRPSMWLDYNKNGRSDFMCTNAVQYLLRNGKLHAVVQMRSNDAVFGYKNDRAWQQHVLEKLAGDLGVPAGDLYWNVGSLHVYARHYHLVDPVNYPKA